LRYDGSVRILALYDIHGNPDALDAVLADPRAADPDIVVVGGDTVPGAFCEAALERLDGLEVPVRWVRGNGDREVTADDVGAERARVLAELPLTVTVDGVLFCHASPRSDDEMLTRLSPPERWADALAGVDAALVVAGHTHQQDDRMVGAVRFVNAGSVGLPYEGDGAARWLWIQDGAPELRRTEYDAAATGRRMRDVSPALAESFDASLIEPVDPIVVTRLFEGLDR
jgi:putative phosphoesterase